MAINRILTVPLVVVAVLLAGCAGPSSPPNQVPASSAEEPAADADVETGQILGRVLNDEFQMLGGVTARVAETALVAVTSDDGVFLLRTVPVGQHTLSLTKPGYTPKDIAVEIRADERSLVEAFLLKAPNTAAYVDAGFTFRGQISCSARVNVTGTDANPECGAVEPQFDQSRSTFVDFLPNLRWTLIEVDWVPSIPAVNEELTLAIRPFVGESWKQVEGPAPIRVLLGPDDWTSILEYANRDYPKNGGQLQLYMFPGEPVNSNGAGAGAATLQDFRIYATSWYGMDPEPGFSRIAPR